MTQPSPFPRAVVGGVSLPRLLIGTNWFLGYSHTSLAKDKLIKAAQGLTLSEAENAFAKAIAHDGRLCKDDVPLVLEEKRQILRKTGLLEFVGTKMLKCRVYPMTPNSETKVKLDYSLALKADGGLYEFTYPLRSAKPEEGKIGTCALRVRIEEKE